MLASKVIFSESRVYTAASGWVYGSLLLCMIKCLETEQGNQLLSMVRKT